MPTLYLRGHRITVEEPTFWAMIGNFVNSTFELARLMHRLQHQGFPDYAVNLWKPIIPERVVEIDELHSQLAEGELRSDLMSLASLLQELDALDNQMIGVIARVVARPIPHTKDGFRKFRRKVDDFLKKNIGAVWINEVEYKRFLEQSDQVFQEISQIKGRVSQYLEIKIDSPSSDSENP